MNRTKAALFFIFLACAGLLGVAMYLQIVLDMLPCPLCVLQRYAFALIGISALITLALPSLQRKLMVASSLFGCFGAGVAGYQLWAISQPPGACGVDKVEVIVNGFFVADLLPIMFKANGLCETPYDPILGLSIPTWSLLWFIAFVFVSILLFASKKKERNFFGKIRA